MIEKLVGVIGWPVSHSLSPAMHNRAFRECGFSDWRYVALPVENAQVKNAVHGLRALGFVGANVTVPHKETVLPHLDRVSDDARLIKAVNTIAIEKDGALVGHNTDVIGLIADFTEHKIDLKNHRALILGAGGSARAVVHALMRMGCADITIMNRTKNKADDIAAEIVAIREDVKFRTASLNLGSDDPIAGYKIIINTTSLGMGDARGEMPWNSSLAFTKDQIVYDLIYNPEQTLLLRHAVLCGARAINGLGMLVHQGAASFEIWTGKKAPVEAMREAAVLGLS